MSLEDESYRNALTEVSPALNKILEPFNVIATEFESDYAGYIDLNHAEFVKTNPLIKKIKEGFSVVS